MKARNAVGSLLLRAIHLLAFAVQLPMAMALPAAPEPTVDTLFPAADATVRELPFIEVDFSGPVSGVEASDLLINGLAATNVTEVAPGQFLFSFPEPAVGPVKVEWGPAHGIVATADPGVAFKGGSWRYVLDPTAEPAGLVISEFMAVNDRTLRDEDGDPSDWIELFNGSDETLNLEGFFLTDAATNLVKWRFPAYIMAPREYLVVYASEKNKTNSTGKLHTNFKLAAEGEYLALVSARTNILSEFRPAYPVQQADVSYGRVAGDGAEAGYFTKATPGAANASGGPGFASEVTFSRLSGTFVEPFELRLGTGPKAGELRYTLDGSVPTNSSPVYVEPIAITNSMQVRARVYEPGLLPGPLRTETFVMLSTNLVPFTSDLPVLIIHALGKGIPSAGRQTSAHLSFFEPRHGVTSLTNPPSLVLRSGIKLRGSSTQGLPKSSFAVELWDEFNQDESHELLGMPADSDWVLYAPNIYEPVLIHNPFIHQLSRNMGRYSPRTRFVEVYLNRSTGAVSTANYNGIYVLEEKIKIAEDRLDIDRLQPEHVRPPEVTGGYLLKIDRLDPGDVGFSGGGQLIAYVDPKEKEIRTPQRDPQEQFIRNYFSSFGRALSGTNWLDPDLGYAAFVDVDAWIDFHVVELLSGNVDAIVLSTYFHKPRNAKIVFGPHWDFDRALGSTDGRDSNPRNWVTGPFFNGWWSRLFRDPDFWQRWIDRFEELRQSHFSLANLHGLIDRFADEVRQAQPRERQKWRVSLRGGSYQSEVDWMKNWLSNRVTFIDNQLVPPPKLSAAGGRVTPGFTLQISGPTNATIFYTLDGSDPRLRQGGVSPKAIELTGPIVVDKTVRVVARARNLAKRQTGGPPISSPWSGPVAATFVAAPPALLVTELMFHPAPDATAAHSASDFEFLELKNVSAEAVDLPGYHFTSGVEFRFTTNGPITRLGAGERLVLVRNEEAFRMRYPANARVGGVYAGSLSNGGGRLAMAGPLEEPIFDFVYDDGWQPLADGFGFSLVLQSEASSPAALGTPAAWRLSAAVGGSPASADGNPVPVPHVLVNELLSNPPAAGKDAVEIFNPEPQPADISGWYLTDDRAVPKKLRLPVGSFVPANGYLVLDTFSTANGDLAFSKAGEAVYLFSANPAGELTGWFHGFEFGAADPGISFGRHVTSTGRDTFPAQLVASIGATNRGPRVGPVVIQQVMPVDASLSSEEAATRAYVELSNSSNQTVALFDQDRPTNTWHLRGSVDFDLPPAFTLGPGERVVLVGFDPENDRFDLAQFRSRYGTGTDVRLAGPWSGRLDDSGVVRLWRPGVPEPAAAVVPQILVEDVNYVAPVSGLSGSEPALALGRIDTGAFADDPANWEPVLPTPGESDSDKDGLPDRWERQFNLNAQSTTGESGSDGDPDHDGYSNLQEFASGTNPQDASSYLHLEAGLVGPGRVALSARAVAGRGYTIEFRDSLTAGSWHVLQNWIALQDESWSLEDAIPRGQRFYRLTTP